MTKTGDDLGLPLSWSVSRGGRGTLGSLPTLSRSQGPRSASHSGGRGGRGRRPVVLTYGHEGPSFQLEEPLKGIWVSSEWGEEGGAQTGGRGC